MDLNKKVLFQDLGKIDYQVGLDTQKEIFDGVVAVKLQNRKEETQIQEITKNHLLFVEHPHTYTLGRSGSMNNLLVNNQQLKEIGAKFYDISRGGDITYHGPGQLVAYPIIDLDHFFTDIHKYLRFLEEAVILTLKDYGLDGGRIEGLTGVWLDYIEKRNPRKICAFGVKASRWVTMHGLALNVNADLKYFDYIVPCGITGKAVTSISAELGREIDFQQTKDRLKKHLASVFEMDIV
jgi:lipoyl(octanoyl) transferase